MASAHMSRRYGAQCCTGSFHSAQVSLSRQTHFMHAAARSNMAHPTGAGVHDASTPLWQLAEIKESEIPKKPLQASISVGISKRSSWWPRMHRTSEVCFISGKMSSCKRRFFQLAQPASETSVTVDLVLLARCASTQAWA